ncbi:MAG: hypothetical protein M5U12_26900 [Verrucomicrobia bacterium]|nr:hypothetical protein [Verrucomicrobiota bacterium]
MSALPVSAADFDAGSNGSHGPLTITANTTLDLPPDGIFHCTTLTVNQGVTLRFNKNPLNTPVVLLAQGDVTINGTIDVAGANGSGRHRRRGGRGFDGGHGGFGPSAPANRGGDGYGPGRGLNANNQRAGAYAQAAASNNRTYGNVLIVPLIGGSGAAGFDGNPGYGGGGGGGAILIASNTRITVNGSINASGGSAPYGGGSGGAIRLVAPTGGGGGSLRADGSSSGANGRVRIDCTEPLAFRNLSIQGSVTRGTRMFALPAAQPRLHFVSVAGQAIPVNAAAGVSFELPAGSSPNRPLCSGAKASRARSPSNWWSSPNTLPRRCTTSP